MVFTPGLHSGKESYSHLSWGKGPKDLFLPTGHHHNSVPRRGLQGNRSRPCPYFPLIFVFPRSLTGDLHPVESPLFPPLVTRLSAPCRSFPRLVSAEVPPCSPGVCPSSCLRCEEVVSTVRVETKESLVPSVHRRSSPPSDLEPGFLRQGPGVSGYRERSLGFGQESPKRSHRLSSLPLGEGRSEIPPVSSLRPRYPLVP